MKKMRSLFFLTAVLIAGVTFHSCQKEDNTMPVKANNAAVKDTPACCVPSLPSAPETVYTNGTFNITVTAYNDATKTYVTISRTGGNMTIRYANPGLAVTQTTGTTLAEGVSSHSLNFDNPTGWECGDPVTFSFYLNGLGGGSANTLQTGIITYNLKDVCGCTDNLSASLVCGDPNTVTFTFNAEEAGPIVIQGGLTAGTTIVSASSNVLTLNEDHPSAGGPSNVTRWEGDVAACTPVTVTITFTGGNGIGDWSAKRGDEILGSTVAEDCN